MNLLDLQSSPAAFRSALLIETDAGPKPMAEALDDFQTRDFEAMDKGWQRAAGQEVEGDCFLRGWMERPRGHSKSSDAMVQATWALFASRRQLSGIVAAVDKDQAAINRDHVGRLVNLNPWLGKVIDVQQWAVVNKHTRSSMDFIASDVASSFGLLLDFACLDEVSVWPKRDLFDSIFSACAKKSTCLMLAIGNAGFKETWVWDVREAVRTDPKWYFNALPGAVASWISQANLEEQKRLLPPAAYDRMWNNIWVGAGGDALDEAAINHAFVPGLQPLTAAVSGMEFVCGVDAGIARDASAVCVLGVQRTHSGHGTIRLAHTQIWKPTPGKKVDLQNIEDTLIDLHGKFQFKQINYDPWELRFLASRLQAGGVGRMAGETQFGRQRKEALPMVEVPPTGKNLQAIATETLSAFNDRRLHLFENADLRRDISRMRVVERPYGFRLESPRDATGHGDLGSAFCLALLGASELAAKRIITAGAVFVSAGVDYSSYLTNPASPTNVGPTRYQQFLDQVEARKRAELEEARFLQQQQYAEHQRLAAQAMRERFGHNPRF